MAPEASIRCSILVWVVFCSMMMFGSSAVDGAVDRAIWPYVSTALELHSRVRSSFYIIGYCSNPASAECSALTSLIYSSEAFTRDKMIRIGLLVANTAYWQQHISISSATHLWFACHDGQQIKTRELNFTKTKAYENTVALSQCSTGVPYYHCPQLHPDMTMGMLILNLALAVQQQGAACIAGQLRNTHPVAAQWTREPHTPHRAVEAAMPDAAAAVADPANLTAVIQQALDMHREQQSTWDSCAMWFGYTMLGLMAVMMPCVLVVELIECARERRKAAAAAAAEKTAAAGTSPAPPITQKPANQARLAVVRHSVTTAHHSRVSHPARVPSRSAGAAAAPLSNAAVRAELVGTSAPATAAAAVATTTAKPSKGGVGRDPAKAGTTGHSTSAAGAKDAAAVAAAAAGGAPADGATATAAGKHPLSSSKLSEVDRLWADNAQLAKLVAQLHRELADSRAAATITAQESTTLREILSCLQAHLDSRDSRSEEISVSSSSGTGAAAAAAAEVVDGSSTSSRVDLGGDEPDLVVDTSDGVGRGSLDGWQQVDAEQQE